MDPLSSNFDFPDSDHGATKYEIKIISISQDSPFNILLLVLIDCLQCKRK